MKTKTLGYTIQRLDREPQQQQPTFAEMCKMVWQRLKDVVWSLTFNGRKYDEMYEEYKPVSKLYEQWSQESFERNKLQHIAYLMRRKKFRINQVKFGRL